MANRLTTTPKTWFLECAYCNPADARPNTPRRHEFELTQMAKKLCRNHRTNHFLDYVNAEFDTLDHSILTPTTMIEILTQIHTSLPCDCLSDTTTAIQTALNILPKTHITAHNIIIPTTPIIRTIPTKPAPIQTIAKRTTTTKSAPTTTKQAKPAQATTLLERLKNGTNTQHRA